MPCLKGGAENPEGNRFCGDCGAGLENRCPQCSADNPAGQRFCADCVASRVQAAADPDSVMMTAAAAAA
jgi:hypothetical protein